MITKVAGSQIYIGPVYNVRAPQLSDFQAVASNGWTKIGGVTNVGDFGPSGTMIESKTVDYGFVERVKGIIDYGTFDLTVEYDATDPGQQFLMNNAKGTDSYMFMVVYPDSESGNSTTSYFKGPYSYKNKLGGTDDVISNVFTIGISGESFTILAGPTITFSPAAGALTAGTHGTAYSKTITATGGTGTVSYAITSGALPAPCVLNSATGAISGTPASAGTYNFTITATFSTSGEGSANYSLVIA